MMQGLKSVLKSSALYSLGNLGNKLVGFVLLPLYTDYLTTADYGVLGLLEATSAILVVVLSLRIPTAMIRWCSDTEDERTQKQIVFTSFVSLTVVALLINLVLQPFTTSFSQLFFQKPDYWLYFRLLLLSISLEMLGRVPLEYLRFQERPLPFISINFLRLAAILALNIYLVAYARQGVAGIILSQVIGHGLVLLLCAPYLLSNFVYRFDGQTLREMMVYGYPLIYSTLAAMLLSYTDRYLITYFHDESDLGIYSLAYKVASVAQVFLIQSFQLGFLPIAFKSYQEENFKPFFARVLTYFSLVLVFFILGLSFFSKEVIELVARNPEYWIASGLVPILGFVFFFKGLEYLFTLGLHFDKKTRYNIRIVLLGLVINVLLNIWLIPQYNIWGAAIATLVSSSATVWYSYRISNRFFPVAFEMGKIYKLTVLLIFYTAGLYALNEYSLWIRLISKIILLSMLPVFLWAWNFFSQDEISRLKKTLDQWKKRS